MAANPLLRAPKVSKKPVVTLKDDDGIDVAYHVREMTPDECDAFEEILTEIRATSGKKESARGGRALLICLSACNADGVRFFDEEKDFGALRSAGGLHFAELFKAAVKINKMNADEIENTAKN